MRNTTRLYMGIPIHISGLAVGFVRVCYQLAC
jgi:hypothetical protein